MCFFSFTKKKDPLLRHCCGDARFVTATYRARIDIWKLLVTPQAHKHAYTTAPRHLAVSGASSWGPNNQRPHECVQLKKKKCTNVFSSLQNIRRRLVPGLTRTSHVSITLCRYEVLAALCFGKTFFFNASNFSSAAPERLKIGIRQRQCFSSGRSVCRVKQRRT